MWDNVWTGAQVLAVLGVPGLFLWYVRDRRKSNAESSVAERTVAADVKVKDVGALEAHIAYVERAFEVERVSKDRRIADQDRQIDSLIEELLAVRARLAEREEQIISLRDEVRELTRRVAQLATRTDQLVEEPPTHPPGEEA